MKEISKKEITAIETLISYTNNADAIETIMISNMSKYRLTLDFIAEFRNYIDPCMFSKAAGITSSLVSLCPDFFNIGFYLESETPSADVLLNDDVFSQLSTNDIVNILNKIHYTEITKEIFERLFGIDKTINEILFEKVSCELDSNFLINNANSVSTSIFKNISLKNILTTDVIKEILNNKNDLTIEFFLMALVAGGKLGWILKMIDAAYDGEYNFISSSGTNDDTMLYIINMVPEDRLEKLFSVISQYNSNMISYNAVATVIASKDLDEDFILNNIETFRNVGLLNAIIEYSRERGYEQVILMAACM